MTDALSWLKKRIDGAPTQLRERMLASVTDVPDNHDLHDRLAEAAMVCLQRAMRGQARRDTALELLAADALLTHAAEAAAEAGSETLAAFASNWNAARFEHLLHSSVR
ncbi:MAG: hypothetical protein ACT4O1_08365 [Gemmatimonadota bacterium]